MRWWLIGIIVLVILAALGVFEPLKLRDRKDPATGEVVSPVKAVGPFKLYRPHFGITLGLDLRGGSHLVLQAQRQAVYEFSAAELAQEMSEEERNDLYGELVGLLPPEAIGAGKRDLQLVDDRIRVRTRLEEAVDVGERAEKIRLLLAERFPDVEVKVAKPEDFTSEHLASIERIIENRVNQYGVTEPIIQRQLPDRIVVELPGVKDPEKAKELIRQTAVLQLRHIPRKYAFGEEGGPEITEVAGERVYTFRDPTGKEVPTEKVIDESRVIVSGKDLRPTSRVNSLAGQQTQVTFELQGKAIEEFEDFTRANQKHYLAIVMDGKLISAPVIRATIRREGVIEGGFDKPGGLGEARDLSILLNAGALPFDLEYIESRTVSAQLGQDALIKSLKAGSWGLLAVLVFMALYYRLPGLLADVALVMYVILLLGAIKLVNQVLTLPGILAVILSIGMAVDANIIIFERLKEEIRTGKTMRSAVEAAFKRAWAAILDSNVCSIGTGFVLFYFGTGPIKGFAVALIIGVAVSLFTAVTVTRLFVNMAINTALARKVALFGVSPEEVGQV